MKGLIIKDLYLTKKYCRSLALFVVIFSAMQFLNSESILFALMPVMVGGILPVTLMAYDEQAKWEEYMGTLPCTGADYVEGKYVIGFMGFLVTALITVIVHLIKTGAENLGAFIGVLGLVGLLPASILLPLVFRLGVNKGRIFYYIILGGFAGLIGVKSGMDSGVGMSGLGGTWLFLPLALIVYALSCLLSVRLYNRKKT